MTLTTFRMLWACVGFDGLQKCRWVQCFGYIWLVALSSCTFVSEASSNCCLQHFCVCLTQKWAGVHAIAHSLWNILALVLFKIWKAICTVCQQGNWTHRLCGGYCQEVLVVQFLPLPFFSVLKFLFYGFSCASSTFLLFPYGHTSSVKWYEQEQAVAYCEVKHQSTVYILFFTYDSCCVVILRSSAREPESKLCLSVVAGIFCR